MNLTIKKDNATGSLVALADNQVVTLGTQLRFHINKLVTNKNGKPLAKKDKIEVIGKVTSITFEDLNGEMSWNCIAFAEAPIFNKDGAVVQHYVQFFKLDQYDTFDFV